MDKLFKNQEVAIQMFETFITNFKKRSRTTYSKNYLQDRISGLKERFQEVVKIHSQILLESDKDDRQHHYFKEEIFEKMEERFYDVSDKMKQALEQFIAPTNINTLPTTPSVSVNNVNQLQLPIISIPKFSGNYESWRSFHDQFVSLIHSNLSIPNIQKHQYLISNISGEAAQLLKYITVTDNSYPGAWEILYKRYENKRVLITTQLSRLFSQPASTFENPTSIKRLLDVTNECVHALQNLEIDISNWDPIFVFIVSQKLPSDTRQFWEQSLKSTDTPAYSELCKFLECRFRALEVLSKVKQPSQKKQEAHVFHTYSSSACSICNIDSHSIKDCQEFLNQSPSKRINLIKSNKLCLNCFAFSHTTTKCKSKKSCSKCCKRHNTLLHLENLTNSSTEPRIKRIPSAQFSSNNISFSNSEDPVQSSSSSPLLTSHLSIKERLPKQMVLATALVNVISSTGSTHTLRALIDQGSHASFVSETAMQAIGLPRQGTSIRITGIINSSSSKIKSKTTLRINPHFKNGLEMNIEVLILKSITRVLPLEQVNNIDPFVTKLQLADPTFHEPGKIDLLLGAGILTKILKPGLIFNSTHTLMAQETSLGWIVTGEAETIYNSTHKVCTFTEANVDDTLKRFWEIEEGFLSLKKMSLDDKMCEEYFNTSHKRIKGRYVVRLPFKSPRSNFLLGRSRNMALSRFLQLEKRFKNDSNLFQQYSDCIAEYIKLGHLIEVNTSESDCETIQPNSSVNYSCNYLPHHAVVKTSSTTTKLRVVFDASAKTNNGMSLNDTLLTGPVLQDGLFSILLRWRIHKIVLKADIEKMYRQIEVNPTDCEFQRILWRSSPSDPIKDYKLTTVTFGTAPAPYLAIKSLQQLAIDEKEKFPLASRVVLNDFYVDDLMSGANSVDEALQIQLEIISMLKSGGFEIRKWSSNSTPVVKNVPIKDREINTPLKIDLDNAIKTLGINWHPKTDSFHFRIMLDPCTKVNTKRSLLSEASKLFDPLGWLAPTLIISKMMFQKLWLEVLSWDDPLPVHIQKEWDGFRGTLHLLEKISVERWIGTTDLLSCELHGFSDASEQAYGAVVYVKTVDSSNKVTTRLLVAKSRVAPIKQVSLPRLELCGAVLLSKIMKIAKDTLKINKMYAWTDSSIVLDWLQDRPNKWKCFVANRVSIIHEVLEGNIWRHVSSKQNPADAISRGVLPADLVSHPLWWSGPIWLKLPQSQWPKSLVKSKTTTVDLKKTAVTFTTICPEFQDTLASKYSSFSKLCKISAYAFKWLGKIRDVRGSSNNDLVMTTRYIKRAEQFWIKYAQNLSFSHEIESILGSKTISKKSKLLSLNPFLDENNILRVGGRLKNAPITYDERHPIILPKNDVITQLIIQEAHKTTHHGGTQLMLAHIRTKFWPLGGRNVIRYSQMCDLFPTFC